jgi:hypothetical protein
MGVEMAHFDLVFFFVLWKGVFFGGSEWGLVISARDVDWSRLFGRVMKLEFSVFTGDAGTVALLLFYSKRLPRATYGAT